MENNIRDYVASLFEQAPDTRQAADLKHELTQNLLEKYRDLINQGYSEEAAYNSAISGIGDINELLSGLNSPAQDAEFMARKSSHAAKIAIAVAMYIVAVLPVIILGNTLGVVLMFALAAAATGLIVYASMTKPRYQKAQDTVVEDFKQWNSETSGRREARKAISSALWCIIVVLYFVLSFSTGAWNVTWVIFLIGVALDNILSAAFAIKKGGKQ